MWAGAEKIDMGPQEKVDLHAPVTPTEVPGVHTGKGTGPPSGPV